MDYLYEAAAIGRYKLGVFFVVSSIVLTGCIGGGGGSSSDDPGGAETSRSCDQTLAFSSSPSGGVNSTADYQGARYYAVEDSLCRISPQTNEVSTVDTIDGVDGQLAVTMTFLGQGQGDDQITDVVYPNGTQFFSAKAGTAEAQPRAFSAESEAGNLMQILPRVANHSQPSSVAYLVEVPGTQGQWRVADLDDATDETPRTLPDNKVVVAPVRESSGDLSGWLVRNNPLVSGSGDDLTLSFVPTGEEDDTSYYEELGSFPDASLGLINFTTIGLLDDGTVVLQYFTENSSEYVFYDPDSNEISAEVTIDNGEESLVQSHATDGEHIYAAMVIEDGSASVDRATLYRISAEGGGSSEQLSQVSQDGTTTPNFVVASENHLIWGWNDVGDDTFSGVEAVLNPSSADPEVSEVILAEGDNEGLVFTAAISGYQGDRVFFEGRSADAPPFISRAYWVDLADYASASSDPDLNFHDQALWQGASASGADQFQQGAAENWEVTELFLSELDGDNVSHLRVASADEPDTLIDLGTLSPTNSLTDPTQIPIPLSVQMSPFGLGPYRLMMIGSDLIMVDTRAEGSLTTLAVEDPENPVIRRFDGF